MLDCRQPPELAPGHQQLADDAQKEEPAEDRHEDRPTLVGRGAGSASCWFDAHQKYPVLRMNLGIFSTAG